MTEYHRRIIQFWQQLGLPVYLQGRAPQNAQFPFVTVNLPRPNVMETANASAFVWFKDDGNGTSEKRAAFMDRIADMIPSQGLYLRFANGCAVIDRGMPFLDLYDDPDKASEVIGCVCYYLVRMYKE